MLDVLERHNNNDDDDSLNRVGGQGVTNFSITEILRPEFGRRVRGHRGSTFPSNVAILPSIVNYISGSLPYPLSVRHAEIHRYTNKQCKLEPGELVRPQQGLRLNHEVSPTPTRAKTVSPGANSIPATGSSPIPGSSPLPERVSEQVPDGAAGDNKTSPWPAWVYCTRYSDRPSSGPRSRKHKRKSKLTEEKRPRTAFTSEQLQVLKREFGECPYLTEARRHSLSSELQLNESQIKIWFQNKRAKLKKSTPDRGLAKHLMAEGLYNHSNNNQPCHSNPHHSDDN